MNSNSGETGVTPRIKHVGLCQHVYVIDVTSMKVIEKHVNFLFSVTDQDIQLNLHQSLGTTSFITCRRLFVMFHELGGRDWVIRNLS